MELKHDDMLKLERAFFMDRLLEHRLYITEIVPDDAPNDDELV